jgi:Holliday junction resolvase RusA-like endonuclease
MSFDFETGILTIRVVGTPAPQGSKKGFYNKATGRVIVTEDSKRVRPWRDAVVSAALEAREQAGGLTLGGALDVRLTFLLNRPKGHYGTGRNALVVRGSAPTYPTVKPDIDKLTRSTLDALVDALVFRDDNQVVSLLAFKLYAAGQPAGAEITVREM